VGDQADDGQNRIWREGVAAAQTPDQDHAHYYRGNADRDAERPWRRPLTPASVCADAIGSSQSGLLMGEAQRTQRRSARRTNRRRRPAARREAASRTRPRRTEHREERDASHGEALLADPRAVPFGRTEVLDDRDRAGGRLLHHSLGRAPRCDGRTSPDAAATGRPPRPLPALTACGLSGRFVITL